MSALLEDALTLLSDWAPPSEGQENLRREYVGHLRANPTGLGRRCYPDHVTASTLILSADHSEVLLTLHAKAKAWFQLGGHCERDDLTLAGAALREAVEESGVPGLALDPQPVQLSVHDVPFCDARGGVHHLDVRFVAVAPQLSSPTASDESDDVAWWPVDRLPTEEPALLELVELARRRVSAQSASATIAAAPSAEQSGGSATIAS